MQPRKLYRSTTDRRIAGVCGGLAEYLGVDATIIRLMFLFFLIAGVGSSLILYLIMWLVVPERPAGA